MEMTLTTEGSKCTLSIIGKIDSSNAKEFEEKAKTITDIKQLVLDLKGLEYISSAGLRVILNLRKHYPGIELINASTNVYDILEMTGFTDMMKISRALRELSLEGAEMIGQGANGSVYRTNDDTVIKVYRSGISLESIENERNVARKALVYGIPTAISYDMVMVDGCYATVFEMIDAASFAKLLKRNPENLKEYAKLSIDLLKLIHSIEAPKDSLPNEKEIVLSYVRFLKDHLPEEEYAKLYRLFESIPETDHIIHGDFHVKNVMYQNNEVIMIDMDTLATGDPLLEFGFMYNAYIGYALHNPKEIEAFLGIPSETAAAFFEESCRCYFSDKNEEELEMIRKRIKLVGLPRVLRRLIRMNSDSKLISYYQKELIDTIHSVDSLY